jgi:hypothetical protein
MTHPATPTPLRWVIPSAVVGVLVGLFALLVTQRDQDARYSIDGSGGQDVETTDAHEFTAWLSRMTPLARSLQVTFDDAEKAASARDFAGTATACRAGLDLTSALAAELPSPDPRMDDPLRQAITDYDMALHLCVSGSEDAEPVELAMAADLLEAGDQLWAIAAGTTDPAAPGLPLRLPRPSPVFKT